MFVYYFVDPNPGVEIFFKKEGATEKGDADSEIGDWGTLAHLYCVMRKIHAEPVYFVIVFFSFSFFFVFLVTKKKNIFWKLLGLYFHHLIIEFFWVIQLQFEIKGKIHTKTLVDVSRGGGAGTFGSCFARGANNLHEGRVCMRELGGE